MLPMAAPPRTHRWRLWIVSATVTGTILIAAGLLLFRHPDNTSAEEFIARARSATASGDFRAALVDLRSALAQHPENLTARLLYAEAFVDLGDGEAALTELHHAQLGGASELDMAKLRAEAELLAGKFEDVVKHTAEPPEAASTSLKASLMAVRGSALFALHQTESALAAIEEGLALDPHSLDPLIIGARASIATGDAATAHQRLAAAQAEAPDDAKVMQLQGDVAFADGDFAAAEEAYRQVAAAQPHNLVARTDIARVEIAADKLQEAIGSLDDLLADSPKNPNLNYLRALAAYRQKDFAAAQYYSMNVLAAAVDCAPAQLIAGAASYALGQYEQAGAYYLKKYVSNNPTDVTARKLLASLQMRLGEPAGAVEALSPALAHSNDDPKLLFMIGVAAARAGDMVAANRYLKQAVEKEPENSGLRVELGKTEVALGDAKAAIEEFETAVKANPQAFGPQASLFRAYLRAREFDKAMAVAQRVIQNQPNSPAGFNMMAAAYFGRGDREAARASFLRAREIRRSDVDANSNLAKFALADGKVDEARQYYLDILEENPKSAQTYRDLAALEIRAGRPAEAEADLARGVPANPEDPVAVAALALFKLAEGKSQDAFDTVQQVVPKWPRDPVLLDVLGRAQLALGRAGPAVSTFLDLVNVAPRAALAHRHLAEAYLAEGKPERAIPEATEAANLDPTNKSTKLSLARALVSGGQPADARKLIDDLRAGYPDDIAVNELDGIVASQQGRLLDAIGAFGRAVALADNGTDRRRLAQAQLAVGRTGEAETTLTTWLGAHPEDFETRKTLAALYMQGERFTEASKELAELIKKDPADALVATNLGRALARLGRAREALAYARRAVSLAPDSAETLDALGTILSENGMAEEAVDSLDRAYRISPSRSDIQLHLAQALNATGKTSEARDVLRALLIGDEPFKGRDQAQQLLNELGG